jgi:hypothetical protein
MSVRTFFMQLAGITASVSAMLAILYFLIPGVQPHLYFGIASILLFVLICTGLYYWGVSAATSSSKLAFNSLISVSVFGKMVLALGFLFLYQQAAKPENTWFVGIFLICYVVYTVFEVWFMSKLARMS